jgi:hypothetical protein
MINPLSTSIAGLMASSQKAQGAASAITNTSGEQDKNLITMKEAEISYKSNAAALKIERDMQDTLQKALGKNLDIKA